MLGAILLIWIGMQLQAPVLYYIGCGVMIFVRLCEGMYKMFEAGQKCK